MTTLIQYGWGLPQQNYFNSLHTKLSPGRVISIQGFKYFLITENGELETELSGKLLFENENENLPKVGDWVLYTAYDTIGYIVEVFPRVNALSRRNPGRKVEAQVLAANIDYAIIVQGLDSNFNLMRLDRYIVQIRNGNIQPVVVLNKADLIENRDHYIEEVNRLRRDVPVYLCSTYNGVGIAEIQNEILQPGKTCVLIGSSGVGKSSILNALLSREVQQIGSISDITSKGKHTTTSRELFRLSNGCLVIDTPGMREFGMTGGDELTDDDQFPVLAELSKHCRYSDCKHLNETGCAVLDALENGSLDPVIYESYIKLIKEQRRFQISADEKKQQAKFFGKLTKEAKAHRKKYKY
jgi:ribosome biogenesis GTPase / thiamine phosphate phosphatase